MPLPVFNRLNLKEFETSRLQDNVAQALVPVLSNPLLNGRLIEGVFLSTSAATPVEHKLGRRALGYIVVAKNASATVYNGDINDNYIQIITDVNCTVSLWVF